MCAPSGGSTPRVQRSETKVSRAWPRGIVDTHVHTAPDVIPRTQTDIELVQSATDAEYRSVVLKSHHTETGSRAAIANDVVGGMEAYGGVVLNLHATGGINPTAVDSALRLGAKVVWLPTISASNQLHALDEHKEGSLSVDFIKALGEVDPDSSGVELLDKEGGVLPELAKVLDLVAADGATLATGHISRDEMMVVIPEARRRGVKNVIVTHPEFKTISPSIDDQLELADLGNVWFERVYALFTPVFGYPIDMALDNMRAVGVSSTIMASDLGQAGNPIPTAGLQMYIEEVRAAGFSTDDIEQMTCINPATALDLEPVG